MIGEPASTRPNGLKPGAPAPPFQLPGTDGSAHSLPAGGEAAAIVIVFTCNHCPYALAWHDRILAVAADYADRGVRFFAISANDAERYPHDSFDAMKQRVAEQGPWPMPYLHDESQDVARAYDAQTTPDVYVFDAELKLAYSGAPDADFDDPELNAAWLRGALDAVLDGRPADPAETGPVGCSIKWRQ
ncbi:MAG: thioredoxin family protein [Actinobacteria bacterium]|nr:thioredoxin family protein [Actinomycetota bacterium]